MNVVGTSFCVIEVNCCKDVYHRLYIFASLLSSFGINKKKRESPYLLLIPLFEAFALPINVE